MSFRRSAKPYGGYPSWRAWRDANATELTSAGVPTIALESEWNWGFFLQEADPTLIGGPPFDVRDLTRAQLSILHRITLGIMTEARGGDLLRELERALRDTSEA